jgi:hypothetical protein
MGERVVDTQRCRSSRNTRLLDFSKEFSFRDFFNFLITFK